MTSGMFIAGPGGEGPVSDEGKLRASLNQRWLAAIVSQFELDFMTLIPLRVFHRQTVDDAHAEAHRPKDSADLLLIETIVGCCLDGPPAGIVVDRVVERTTTVPRQIVSLWVRSLVQNGILQTDLAVDMSLDSAIPFLARKLRSVDSYLAAQLDELSKSLDAAVGASSVADRTVAVQLAESQAQDLCPLESSPVVQITVKS